MKTIHEFRNRLDAFLAEAKLTQTELSQRSGVPQYTISRFLAGKDLSGRYLVPLQNTMSDWQGELPVPLSAQSGEGERGDGNV